MADKVEIIIEGKDQYSGVFNKLIGLMPSFKQVMVGAGAAVAGVSAALIANAKSVADNYDKIQKFSDRIGISTEALSSYHYIAERSGLSTQQLNMGFQRMTRRIAEAAQGTGVAKDALNSLGIAVDSIHGKRPDEQFEMIAKAMESVKNQSDKAALAMKFFDSEGVGLLQTMTEGTAGLERMKKEAEAFGIVISSKAGANAAAFNDMITRVGSSIQGLRNYIAEETMPVITGLGNRLASFIAQNRPAILDFAEKSALAMAHFAEYTAYGVAGMIDSWRGLKMIWLTLRASFQEFTVFIAKGINKVVTGIYEMVQAVNIGGVLDDQVIQINHALNSNSVAIANLQFQAAKMWESLRGEASGESAISKVNEFVETAKEKFKELKEEGAVFKLPTADELDEFGAKTIETLNTIQEDAGSFRDIIGTDDEFVKAEQDRQQKIQDNTRNNTQGYLKLFQMEKDTKIKMANDSYTTLEKLATVFGRKGFIAAKALSLGRAVMGIAAGAANALRDVPYPANLAAAASVIATGAATILPQIIGQSFSGQAHSGLDYVPREGTYLLDKGERIIKSDQNRDLTNALNGGGLGGNVSIETLHLHIAENATTAEKLLDIDENNWMSIISEKIAPGLKALKTQGVEI